MIQQNVNRPIVDSIPMDKQMKKYFIKLYQKMIIHNGPRYACDKFKGLREVLMQYRADPQRKQHEAEYWKLSGFRTNGWLKKLFAYSDSNPQYAFNFVKLYCGFHKEPVVSVEEAVENQHKTLEETAAVNTRVPGFLERWLLMIKRGPITRQEYYHVKKTGKPSWLASFAKKHSYKEYSNYVYRWRGKLRVRPLSKQDMSDAIDNYRPSTTIYIDVESDKQSSLYRSTSFEEDTIQFLAMGWSIGDEPWSILDAKTYNWCLNKINPALAWYSDEDYVDLCKEAGHKLSFMDGQYLGQIHHIPKKGTVKRRSICAPNRYLQCGMAIADAQLTQVAKQLGATYEEQYGTPELAGDNEYADKHLLRDCTFNQTACNSYIIECVNNPHRYAGSVDLHQATDFLPFSWMERIWEVLFEPYVPNDVKMSWELFKQFSKGPMLNGDYLDRWVTGQPLGAVPSFRCLCLTHNLLLESLSFVCGYDYSPYVVLGDDVVIMQQKVRSRYIKLMNQAGVPLSLHKSYEHHLVEFAGQVFIKNNAPFYTSDQVPVLWHNLFSFQTCTGIYIPWDKVPDKVQRQFVKAVGRAMQMSIATCYTGDKLKALAKEVYRCIQIDIFCARGSSKCLQDLATADLYEYHYSKSTEEKIIPDSPTYTGINRFGKTIVDLSPTVNVPHRVRTPANEQKWFKDKFLNRGSTEELVNTWTDTYLSSAASIQRIEKELK